MVRLLGAFVSADGLWRAEVYAGLRSTDQWCRLLHRKRVMRDRLVVGGRWSVAQDDVTAVFLECFLQPSEMRE
ncbi:hypothetical protein [Micromonospora chersina]